MVHHERAARSLELYGILSHDVAKPKKECECQESVFTNSLVGTKTGGRPLVIKGTYDKNGLPSDFPELAEDILDFMQFYGIGEILNPSVYMKAKRKTNDYIFCSVEFSESGKSYYYTTEDDTLEIGDDVLVPVGNDGHTAIVKIVNIEYFPEDKVPFPLDKAKSIIGKCTEDELNPPILNDETSENEDLFCPLYNGNISQYDCDEISYGAKHGWIPNDGLPKLIDIETIKKKRELCLVCERYRENIGLRE